MDCNSKKEALKKMKSLKLQDGGEVPSDISNFDEEGQRRLAEYMFNKSNSVVPDYGDSEDERMRHFSDEEKLKRLAAYFGVDLDKGRSPASEVETRQGLGKTIPEGTDEETARKMLILKSLKDRR